MKRKRDILKEGELGENGEDPPFRDVDCLESSKEECMAELC